MAKRILLVDDEEDLCETLKEELEDNGYEAEYATTGEVALDLINQSDWDMAIVDLKLSTKITGLSVMETLHKVQPKAIIVAISGYEDIGMRQKVERLGGKDFFRKPNDVQIGVLHKKIEALFNQYGS